MKEDGSAGESEEASRGDRGAVDVEVPIREMSKENLLAPSDGPDAGSSETVAGGGDPLKGPGSDGVVVVDDGDYEPGSTADPDAEVKWV